MFASLLAYIFIYLYFKLNFKLQLNNRFGFEMNQLWSKLKLEVIMEVVPIIDDFFIIIIVNGIFISNSSTSAAQFQCPISCSVHSIILTQPLIWYFNFL